MAEALWCAIRLPQLPLEAQMPATPAVLAGRHRVLLACPASTAAGITPGMKLSTAHALLDALHVLSRAPQEEARQLRQLSWQLLCFTPSVAVHRPCPAEQSARARPDDLATLPGLLLELGSCLKLFRGSEALLVSLFTTLTRTGLCWRAGLGHTPLAAWALSHAAPEASLQALHQSRQGSTPDGPSAAGLFLQTLHHLPLEALPLQETLKDTLQAPGFRTLSDLISLPRPALGKRFGRDFLHWLERLLGERPDPREPITPPTRFHSQADFDEPLAQHQHLLPVMARQLNELESYLHWRHQAVRSIRWQFLDHQGEAPALIVRRTRPGADAQTWLTLTSRHLEQWTLRAPVLRTQLTTSRPEQAAGHSGQLFHDPGERAGRPALLEKLASLPGLQLHQMHRCDDHLPEQAQALTDPLAPASDQPPRLTACARQPLWLFDPPQPLACDAQGQPRWRGARLMLLAPDQRLSSHWWQQPLARDYVVARHPGNQALCWLYLDDSGWFLHGLF